VTANGHWSGQPYSSEPKPFFEIAMPYRSWRIKSLSPGRRIVRYITGMRPLPLCLVLLRSLAQAADSPPALPLHAQGRELADAHGDPVVLHALNLAGMGFGNGEPAADAGPRSGIYSVYHVPAPEALANIRQWGFNAVRLPLSWANIEPRAPEAGRHHWQEAYLQEIEDVLHAAAKQGLPVILSLHHSDWSSSYHQGGGMPAWVLPGKADPQAAEDAFFTDRAMQDAYIAVWSMLLERLGGTSTALCALDLYNEPRCAPGAEARQRRAGELASFYERALAALPSDRHVVLLCQDVVDRHPVLDKLPVGAVYSFHSYGPWTGDRLTSLQEHLADHHPYRRSGGDWRDRPQGQPRLAARPRTPTPGSSPPADILGLFRL